MAGPSVNTETQKIDIAIWHPDFPRFDDQTRWTVLFLFLDQVLGEYGTQQWIGEITFDAKQLGNAISISEIHEYVTNAQAVHGWNRLPPGESTSLYQCKDPHNRFLRGDIVSGITVNRRLLNEYTDAEGKLPNPIPETGADYVFLAIPSSQFPRGKEVSTRGEIEDALDAELKTQASGRLVGGAFGTQNAYIDLLICDGQNTIDFVRKVIAKFPAVRGATLHYFAHEKRGHKIAL